jgi:hypothetical protein
VSPATARISSFVRRTLFAFANGARYGPSDFRLVPENYAPKNSLDRGAQLEVVWLDDTGQ